MGAPRQYTATVVRVIDADTIQMDISLGFYVRTRLSCRLVGINAFELSEPGGKEARDHLAELLPAGSEVQVTSVAVDKYSGRFDGRITLADGRDAATAMVDAGYAVKWTGRGAKPSPVWPIPEPTG